MKRADITASVLGVVLGFIFVMWAISTYGTQARAQAPHITADSAAIVVLVNNNTSVPVEMFLKIAMTYHKLEPTCAPSSHCLYVVPSVQLGNTSSYQISGLAHGETVPDDSPLYMRAPDRPSISGYNISPPQARLPERT